MGAHHNDSRNPTQRSSTRGSVRNADRLAAFAEPSKKGNADWGACDPKRLQDTVVAITALGGAITFGLSRDEGAHSLHLMLDDSRATLWFNGDADLDEELDGVIARLTATT